MKNYAIKTLHMFGAVSFCLSASSALAAVVVSGGPSTIGSDSVNGKILRVVTQNSGFDRITIMATPSVAFVCSNVENKTSCFAYIKPDQRVRVTLRRARNARSPANEEVSPTAAQWGLDCAGTLGPECIVSMNQPRAVFVDWSK